MNSTHPCRAIGCGKQIDRNFLMCPAHWLKVPMPAQKKVYAAFRAWKKHPDEAALAALSAAQQAAVEAIL